MNFSHMKRGIFLLFSSALIASAVLWAFDIGSVLGMGVTTLVGFIGGMYFLHGIVSRKKTGGRS